MYKVVELPPSQLMRTERCCSQGSGIPSLAALLLDVCATAESLRALFIRHAALPSTSMHCGNHHAVLPAARHAAVLHQKRASGSTQ